jgi:hypothetical protein
MGLESVVFKRQSRIDRANRNRDHGATGLFVSGIASEGRIRYGIA